MQEAKNNLKLSTMRHSLAHIMAAAVQRLYPDAKFGVGPSIEDGFYYDIDLGEKKISEKDFVKIEKMMQKIIKENQRFIRTEKTIEEAIEWAKEKKQDYKLELLNDLKKYGTTNANVISSEIFDDKEIENDIKTVSFYTNGNYQDLCRGPHVDDTSKIGAFKIMKVAGAYWRGNENNPQMQRLYGVAFDSEEELEQYLNKLEEAKKAYPLIRMSYERSEPIAESFGESDVKIDFRLADYLDENKTEEGWSGFHRIERILWEENTTKGTESYGDQLVNDIKELKAKIATVDVDYKIMLTGAVDLLNEVATSKITGEEEIYSHTDLYDFRANIQGAEKIFQLFKPLLEKSDAALVKELEEDFKSVNSLLDKHMTDKEHYKLYTDLTKEDTKELSEAVTKLGEPLSQMGKFLGGE